MLGSRFGAGVAVGYRRGRGGQSQRWRRGAGVGGWGMAAPLLCWFKSLYMTARARGSRAGRGHCGASGGQASHSEHGRGSLLPRGRSQAGLAGAPGGSDRTRCSRLA